MCLQRGITVKHGKWELGIAACSFMVCLIGLMVIWSVDPEETVSRSERRRLAKRPELTWGSIVDKSFMDDTEEYLLDHFPFRDGLRRIKAYFAYDVLRQKENNDIYVVDNHASKLEYPLNEASVKRLSAKMVGLWQQYFPEQKVWYAIVPDKNYFLAEKNGYTFIHPFDDLAVATGQGTIAMEIFKELPLVEYILVPIGGGGLATGVSTLAKLLNPKIKVIGVEPAGASCMKASFEAGKVVTLPTVNTIADGTAVKTPGENIFPYIKKNLDDIIAVNDDELVVAFLDMVENHKMVAENSGLLTVAALKHLNVKDKRVVSIISGGNMDVITMSSVVQQGLILRDRIFTVSVLLPDKPGELSKVSETIAKEQGNVIKLEHNQFVSINRNAAVELRITLECFGTDHKRQIMKALEKAGYKPKQVRTNL